MCPLTWRATVMTLLVASQMMLGSLTTVQSLEDDEIEKWLNHFNKPAVKSITLEDGEIVDCVDIYKQPAFDHPLLKDHKIQMRPSFLPKTGKSGEASESRPLVQPLWQKSEGCPEGTIPIRRVQRDDLIRATSIETLGRRRVAAIGTIEIAEVGVEKGGPYLGTRGRINVWQVPVEPTEWSNARLQLSDGKNYSIEAGWMENPQLFGDGRPRLFSYWTADGGEKIGCFNLLCPGFVQVGRDFVVGTPVYVSVHQGPQFDVGVNITQDNRHDNWWVLIENRIIGYWPVKLFGQGGFPEASTVRWGGGVLNMNSRGRHTITQMGSGKYANMRRGVAAYVRDVEVEIKLPNGTANAAVPPRRDLLWIFQHHGDCYSAIINDDPKDANFMYFGGPGGFDCTLSS